MEQQFHALRRLVASKAGFAGFTNLPGFREKVGTSVIRPLEKLLNKTFAKKATCQKGCCQIGQVELLSFNIQLTVRRCVLL